MCHLSLERTLKENIDIAVPGLAFLGMGYPGALDKLPLLWLGKPFVKNRSADY